MCIDQGADKCGLRSDKVRLADSGFTLIELIVFIVIVSVALAGILTVMNKVTGHSADSLILKQEIAIAESMLEEVELQDFIAGSPATPVPNPPGNRTTGYHIVSGYNGFHSTGIYTPDGNAVAGLTSYDVDVAVTNLGLNPTTGAAIPAASSVQITVTVSNTTVPAGDPLRQTVIDGYRTAY